MSLTILLSCAHYLYSENQRKLVKFTRQGGIYAKLNTSYFASMNTIGEMKQSVLRLKKRSVTWISGADPPGLWGMFSWPGISHLALALQLITKTNVVFHNCLYPT